MVIGDFSSKPSRVVPSSASSSVTNIKARAQPQQQISRKQRRFHTRRIPTTQSSPAIAVLGNLFPVDQYGDESSKLSSSQSGGSPQGTLQLAGSDSMEEDGDDRSE
nr:transcription factor HHO2-like [Ipomoea batatas]